MNTPATLLLVDDLAANRETLVELLEPQNYRIFEAADGPAALLLAADCRPDLVLLDVMMPGMDGYEVCRHLRADARLAEVPVLMITTLDDQASRLAGIEAGADDFITKPFNRAELRARVRTITRLNRYRRLMETQEQLLRSQRIESLGMLSAGIAHDFNNALAAILMGAPLLRSRVGDPGGQRILDTVEKSAQRGAALVRQMMTFARGAGDRSQVLQARHVLREVAELAETTFPKSIRVEPHLPADLWPVQANPTQLHQVFLNLCVNARDAMPQGGTLSLTAENRTLDAAEAAGIADARPGAFLTVEVRDTGTGIAPEVLARIWEPFFTTKGEGQGTGLGLSTVRGILHEHEGFATVQTRAGHGTAFTVYLPAAAGEGGGEAAAGAVPALRGGGELILVAEDDEVVRELTAHLLTAHGYQVVTACDGAAAIAAFATCAAEVRLLLTDMQMPMLGGPALAAALRRLNPGLPIVAMSGAHSRDSALHKTFTTAFLAKPFQAETLLSIVRRTLDAARPTVASSPAT
jgi:CheY-like chemotaxis protein